jgi:hypothetical protein
MDPGSRRLSSILRHDTRTTSYKLALVRAVNDVLLSYPTAEPDSLGILIPLRHLAAWWVAYYWPFTAEQRPIYQGARNMRAGRRYNDIGFRPQLTKLRAEWEQFVGSSKASDGFFLRSEMTIPRRRQALSPTLLLAYQETLRAITESIKDPIQYAGPKGSQWDVFSKPCKAAQYRAEFGDAVAAIPDTLPGDVCLLLPMSLWRTFLELSLWIEALCIHEWCLFTESVRENQGAGVERGSVYTLLTDRPGNRRPLTWERNQVDILLLEGTWFTCPWTGKTIQTPGGYDLDHIIPIALYPINELWNLVPADSDFNSHQKRDRLPSAMRIQQSSLTIGTCYANYLHSLPLRQALLTESASRFRSAPTTPDEIVAEVVAYVTQFGTMRNVATF